MGRGIWVFIPFRESGSMAIFWFIVIGFLSAFLWGRIQPSYSFSGYDVQDLYNDETLSKRAKLTYKHYLFSDKVNGHLELKYNDTSDDRNCYTIDADFKGKLKGNEINVRLIGDRSNLAEFSSNMPRKYNELLNYSTTDKSKVVVEGITLDGGKNWFTFF